VKRWKALVALALAAAFLGVLGFGLTRDAQVLPSAIIGQKAPQFDLETLDGDSIDLSSLQGQVVLLNFWASWCIPCREEHPVLEMADKRYDGKGVRLIGVVYQDTRSNARRFLEQHGGGWPSVLDPSSRVAISYGVYGVPETYFVDPTGRVVQKHVGPLTWDLLSSTVDSLLASGKGAAPDTTAASGTAGVGADAAAGPEATGSGARTQR